MVNQPNQDGHGGGEKGPGHPTPGTDELLPLVYDELRAIAASCLSDERAGHTLQPTALVHEAYLRLAEMDRMRWRDKAHFHVAASGVIRRVLVDHARKRKALKRGGPRRRLTLADSDVALTDTAIDVLALDEALATLAQLAERKCRVVELRFFGGLTIEETAAALDVGTTTVEDDWAFARAWLRQSLAGDSSP